MQNIIMEKHIVSKKYDQAFITGCDEGHAWMLPWFVKNYKRHNSTPLIFSDFGVSEKTLEYVRREFHCVLDMTKVKEAGWFKKPRSMLYAPAKKTVWIDTDCEILDNIEDIFNKLVPNKLAMVEDKPWSKRRGELWHNSGIVGFIGKPIILHNWCQKVHDDPLVGDQEVLHSMVRKDSLSRQIYIEDLPNEYNWLRLQLDQGHDSKRKKIMHWTGNKGKDKIRRLIKKNG